MCFVLKVVKSWESDYTQRHSPFNRTLSILISPDTHGVKNLAIGLVVLPPHSKSDSHSHSENEEFWIIADGKGEIIVDGEKTAVEPGMIVCAPPLSSHQIANTGNYPLRAYFLYAPPGPEKKILEEIREHKESK